MIKVGINYKQRLGKEILENIDKIDILEVYTEKFFSPNNDPYIEKIKKLRPLIFHGLDLSLGSSSTLDKEYMSQLKNVLDSQKYSWFSDHICMTKESDVEVGHLMPIAFSDKNVAKISKKVQQVQQLSNRPFLLENITYYYQMPESDLSEVDFITAILERSGANMLLDINNLWINSKNHNYCPLKYLDKILPSKVIEIHMAGGSFKEGIHVDSHANDITTQVWDLLDEALRRFTPKAIIIERDSNIDRLQVALDEVKKARELIRRHE